MTSPTGRISLRVPAATDHLQLLRLNVALVAGASFDVDEVEDLKLAVEELGAALVGLESAGPTIDLDVDIESAGITVEGRRRVEAGEAVAIQDFVATILDAIVDDHRFSVEDGVAVFTLRKLARP